MKRALIFIWVIFSANFLFAQDSLYFEDLKLKAESHYYAHPDSTLIYADSLIRLTSVMDDKTYLGEGNRLKGVFFQLKGQSDSAKKYFEAAVAIHRSAQDSVRLVRAMMSSALMDVNIGAFQSALETFLESEKIATKVKNESLRLRAIAEIGRIYSFQGDHEEALEKFRYYYKKIIPTKDLAQIGTALNYISVEFMHLKDRDSSLHYLYENLEVQKKLNYGLGVASALQNIASVHLDSGNDTLALEYFEQALDYNNKLGYGRGIGHVSINLADLYIKQAKFQEAVRVLKKAAVFSEEIRDYHALGINYARSSVAYDSLGMKSEALDSYRKYHAVSDSLFSIDKQRTMSEMFTKYETAEKEQQIELQNVQIEGQSVRLQRNQAFIFGLVAVAALLIVIVLLVRNRAQKDKDLIRKEGELKLREAEINAVINSQEKERNRFAKDLHDGFGQMISVLKMNLGQLGESKHPEKQLEVFEQSEAVIGDMYTELRNICFDLMPQTLVQSGLPEALKEFGHRVSSSGNKAVEVLIFDVDERLNELTEVSLYRISQEWVNNILKYSDADQITLQLTCDETELTLTIEDNGKGFNPDDFFNGKGNGWRNIQSRINLMKGEFELDSREGIKGTMMSVNVPVTKAEPIPTGTEEEIAV